MRIFIVPFLLISMSVLAQTGFVQEGKASFYADKFEGRVTASGERYSHQKATCAHLSLPFGSLVKVTNLGNNVSLVLRVNDRGPFVPNRIIDLSRSAAEKLGILPDGTADVRVELLDEKGNMLPALPQSEPASAYKPVVSEPEPQKPYEVKPSQPVKEDIKPEPIKQPVIEKAQVAVLPPQNKPVQNNTPQNETVQNPEIEIYSLIVNKQEKGGFSVQIGSYKELANLIRIAEDLKTSLKKEVIVQVATVGNDKIYRLMVGHFNNRKDAEQFRDKAVKIYSGCFIVELK